MAQSTATATVVYTGFQACGGCTICGADYWCFNTPGSYCGNTGPCLTKTFTDPCPAGSIVTSVTVNYFSGDCTGGAMTATLDGNAVPTVHEGNTGCLCSNNPCSQSASSSSNFPCGLPGYVNGGVNTLQMCTGADVCINKLILVFTYAPANQATPAVQPSGITGSAVVCPGTAYNYSASSVNAASYTWTVPAGWTINSGQGTSTINATPGSAGSICVKAVNACGTSAQTCLSVTLNSLSTAATSASASPNPICPSNPTTLSLSGGSLGTGATWHWYSGSCNGTAVGTGSSITVSPSSTTTYYVDAVGTCNTTACANVTVNVGGTTAAPGAPTGTSSVCGGSTQTYNTTGTAGATSYNWTVPAGATINSGQGTTSISVTMGSSSGNVCVTATGACGTSAASCTPITITNTPSTPGSITGTTPVCVGSDGYSIASVAGATSYTWAITGGGSITSGQGTTNATVNWTTAGAYIVSVTASNACGTSTQSTFNLTVNPPPTITANASSSSVCSGTTTTLTASGAGSGSYSWANASTLSSGSGASVTATPLVSPTVYTVTGTDGNGCVNTNTVSITVNPTPTVSISGGGGNSQTICGGGLTNNTVAGINFAVTPAGTINWTNNNTAIGIGSSGTGPISSYPAPAVTSGTSVTGIITATANSGGCPSTTNTQLTYTVIINQIPGSSTAAISPANCGVNNGTITGPTGTGGSGFYSYSWDGGATFSATSSYVNGAGTYTVEIKDNTTGCIFPQSFNIPNAGAPAAPAVTASASSICVGGTATLSITSPVAGNTYSWTPAVGSPGTGTTFTVTVGSTTPNPFTVDVTATALGCVGAATTTSITVNGLPDIPVLTAPTGTNNVYCQGSPTPLTVSSGTTTPASVAVWYSNNTVVNVGNTFTAPVGLPAGTYTFSVIDSIPAVNGCINAPQSANTVTLSVTVNPLPSIPVLTAPTGTNNSFCFGSPSPLTVNTGTNTAVWYSNNTVVNTGSIFNPPASLPAGTYTFSVIDSIPAVNGCISAPQAANTVTLTLVVNPTPTLDVGSGITKDSSLCGKPTGGISVPTANVSGGTAPYSYQWYNGSSPISGATNPTLSNVVAGTYSLHITDVNGCVANITGGPGTFSVPASAIISAAFSTTPSPPTGSVPLNVVFTNGSTGNPAGATLSYVWYFGDNSATSTATNPSHVYNAIGTYSVILVASNNGNCPDTARATVVADVATTLIIPNIFSPNGDGINDQFFINNTGMSSLTCTIFNRWGQLLFTITEPNQAWDGRTPNGDKAPDGTYMYILQAQGMDGKSYKQEGTLTLVR